jgi:uridine phosphorylase
VPERLKSAAEPETAEGLQYHLRVKPGDVARYVLLPGDPGRVDIIAGLMDEGKLVAFHREYKTFTGTYRRVSVSVTSTGIGAPSTAIALEELLRVGADTFIRVGTMGAIQPDLKPGTLVIAYGAVRMEGTSRQYVHEGYPAAAHPEVFMALIEAVETLGYPYRAGIIASTDSFYLGQGRPGFRGYMNSMASKIIPDLAAAGVLGFEMESSLLFTLANLYGARAGCICAVVANRVSDEFIVDAGVQEAARTALEAVKILSSWDEVKRRSGAKWVYPGLLSRGM